MLNIFKKKSNSQDNKLEESMDILKPKEDFIKKSQTNLIIQNEENLLHNLDIKIEDSANQVENLINAIDSIASRVMNK